MARAPRSRSALSSAFASSAASALPTPAEPPRVGQALAALRQQQALSLDELSRRAGVSKSMLSQIERGQANPTVAVVWRLANALSVPLAALLDNAAAVPAPPPIATVAGHETPTLRGPDPGCELRILSPIDAAGQFEWYELRLGPGAQLASQPHEPGTREHLSVLDGTLALQVGDALARLAAGETARYAADQAHRIANDTKLPARAILVVMHA